MSMRIARALLVLTVFSLAVSSVARAGLLSPQILRGSINLRPYGCMAPHALAYWKGHVYVSGASDSGGGPTIWDVDVTDPDNPTYVQSYGEGYKAYGTKIVEDKLYVANWYTMFRTYNISNGALTQLGQYFSPGKYGWAVEVYRGRAFVTQGSEVQAAMEYFDVTNPSNPVLVHSEPALLSGVTGSAARGSYLYYGDNHFSMTIPLYYFVIANISDKDNPYPMTVIERDHAISSVTLRDNLAYLFMGDGLEIWDIADPVNPNMLGSWYGVGGGGQMLGDYTSQGTSGNGVIVLNISDPFNPWAAAQPNYSGYELCTAGNGRFLYIGSLDGDYQGTLRVVELLNSDPDNAGPANWSSFSLADASWDTQYEGDAMPRSSNPVWALFEGAESIASVSGGILHINDNSSTTKLKWRRNWDATSTFGTTILCRARCASYDTTGGSIGTINNIFVEDGKYAEDFAILSDKFRANRANLEAAIDGTQWHTYRITTQGAQFVVYVDDAPAPLMTGPLSSTTSYARIGFGSGSTFCKQDIYLDHLHCFSAGVYGPAGKTNDQTPDISVGVADMAGKGSLSGIDPATAQVYWSRDGGATWTAGGCTVTCTPVIGLQPADRGTIAAQGVPFNQNSETLNKIKFSLRDLNGNIGYSPVYNVRIDPDSGPRVLSVTSPQSSGTYRQGASITVQVVFDRPITVTGGQPKLKLAVIPGGRQISYTSVVNGNTLSMPYPVALNDTSDCLDYTGADALLANGASITDSFGAAADLRLPEPGSPGSLCANKHFVIDGVKPVVTNVTSDNEDRSYTTGEQIDIILTFSEPVSVTGTPQLELETGAVDRKADYISGTGTAALKFRYAVQFLDSSSDLDYKATSSLTGTIKDIASNTMNPALPAPGSMGSLGSNKGIVIETDGSISAAKLLSDGDPVSLGHKALYLKQGAFGYIEESNRSCGIRIEGTISANEGDLACLTGTMRTTTGGERYVELGGIQPCGSLAMKPVGATNRALELRLMDGLYSRVWGQVTSVSLAGHYYYITDGSDDVGVKVLTPGEPGVTTGQQVCVSGAAGWDGARVLYAK